MTLLKLILTERILYNVLVSSKGHFSTEESLKYSILRLRVSRSMFLTLRVGREGGMVLCRYSRRT